MNPYKQVDMFIEWPEGIVDLGIITKEFPEKIASYWESQCMGTWTMLYYG